ncbi:hypothetical protein YC2023_110228 [Brassica napus]
MILVKNEVAASKGDACLRFQRRQLVWRKPEDEKQAKDSAFIRVPASAEQFGRFALPLLCGEKGRIHHQEGEKDPRAQ